MIALVSSHSQMVSVGVRKLTPTYELGLYAFIAVPETQAWQEVADLLITTTQNYSHPLIWLGIFEN
jgi:hypothetical protein